MIRILATGSRASMVHCTLPPDGVSHAVRHATVEELWYIVGGRGEVWRKLGDSEEVVDAIPGVSLHIATGDHFQFRNTGPAPLEIVIATTPPWPGEHEATRVPDHWPVG